MLRDDTSVTDTDRDLDYRSEICGVTSLPASSREGVTDVLSFRGILRAVMTLRRGNHRSKEDDFERALTKMINLNGAMARVIEDGRR